VVVCPNELLTAVLMLPPVAAPVGIIMGARHRSESRRVQAARVSSQKSSNL